MFHANVFREVGHRVAESTGDPLAHEFLLQRQSNEGMLLLFWDLVQRDLIHYLILSLCFVSFHVFHVFHCFHFFIIFKHVVYIQLSLFVFGCLLTFYVNLLYSFHILVYFVAYFIECFMIIL